MPVNEDIDKWRVPLEITTGTVMEPFAASVSRLAEHETKMDLPDVSQFDRELTDRLGSMRPTPVDTSISIASSVILTSKAIEPATARCGWIRIHPRYRTWLQKCGITTAAAALDLVGEVVCGHADRHVVRVELNAGVRTRVVFLKREHVVSKRTRWRNWRDGFGKISRSEREARNLEQLEAAGLPGPQWLAYGEDDTGRAFLLVEELAGAMELRELLTEFELTTEERKGLAIEAGRCVAELHAAGFNTPELSAKHLFVRPGGNNCTLVDWQSCRPGEVVDEKERVRALALLHATIAEELATPAERLRFLASYRRTLLKRGIRPKPDRLTKLSQKIEARAAQWMTRSAVRSQRQPLASTPPQRLVWLAGERVVAVPEIALDWPKPADCAPYYIESKEWTTGTAREWLTLPDGHRAVLIRMNTKAPCGRLIASMRESPWRSPAATAARVLFHLQKYGIAAPRLLAFGQRLTSRIKAESFLLAEPQTEAVPIADRLTDADLSLAKRRILFEECGMRLRQLHDAGCRPSWSRNVNDPLFVAGEKVSIGSPFALRLTRSISTRQRRADVRRLLHTLLDLSATDRRRLVRGYLGSQWHDRAGRRRWK